MPSALVAGAGARFAFSLAFGAVFPALGCDFLPFTGAAGTTGAFVFVANSFTAALSIS